jgi:hypothetical protein
MTTCFCFRGGRLQAALLIALLAAAPASFAQTPPPTRPHVQALASERLGGREAGSAGERLAAEYLAQQLQRLGARPLPGRSDMFAPFTFTAGSKDAGSTISLRRQPAPVSAAAAGSAFVRALSFSDSGEATGSVVFAGYGIVVPETQNFGYDSYAGLDVKDKIVVVLRYFPEDADPQTRAILARYSDLRYKAMQARQRGAKAILVLTGPRSPNAGQHVPMTWDTAIAGSGIVAASIDGRFGDAIFNGQKSLVELQKALDAGNPHTTGLVIPDATITVRTELVRETRTARNVIAYVPATQSVAGIAKPWVAVGAHYDHLGEGRNGNSLAAASDVGRPHVGADDNASGSAAVLAIAGALAQQKARRRHLLVALWSAEEIGLVGSSAFVNAAVVPADQMAAYLNFDMVGRMQDNKLAVQATGTSPSWPAILERVNVAAGFALAIQPDPYQPTDVQTFNGAGVPSLSFTTGAHADYHKPSDTADKINYEDLDRVAGMAAAIVRRVMETPEAPQFSKVEQSAQTATRTGLRIYTGTVPDYTAEAKGLLLGGVTAGGPAAEAGLDKGDVIIEIAGQSITNIYDYTFALDLLKIGQPVKVVYMRGGQRRDTTLTPTARK